MIKALKKKYALSDQGAKDLLKGIVYSVLANISLMFPVILLAIVLNQLLAPVLGASAPEISVLFNNTIMENIRVGKKDATDEEVIAAAKAAQCDEFISKLSDGYQTVIGENGSTLSGGECQRLSIARALLKDAPVILLDEATASLDVDNETEIQNAISRLVKGKTVLIIAHRMRTVEAADNIVVLSDGIVAENGTHEELMKENGLYHRLVDLQTASANWKLSV